jgi:signal transduction histidine kinase/ActR/RegA family two-component response regulator
MPRLLTNLSPLFIGLTGAVLVAIGHLGGGGVAAVLPGLALLLTAVIRSTPRTTAPIESASPPGPDPVEASGAGLWSWSLADGSSRFDAGFRRLAGFDLESGDERFAATLERVHPDDLEAMHKAIETTGDGGGSGLDVVIRLRGDDDHWRRIRLVGDVVASASDGPWLCGLALGTNPVETDTESSARTSDELLRAMSDLAKANTDLERVRIDLERRNRQLEDARRTAIDATRSKSEFLANMSHEIRTPLAAIIGYADLIVDGGGDPSAHTEMAETIRRNGEHLLSLVGDILDLSKIEAGRVEIERIPTDPAACVRDAVGLLTPEANRRGLTLQVEITPTVPPTVSLDPTRFRQVVLNLVGNAVKFTDEGGVVVRLDHHAASNRLEVAVTDTGIGIQPDRRARIFEPFRQADGSTTRRFGGTGLGLSISRRLCDLLGGGLSVDSIPGMGSTFTAAFLAPPTGKAERPADATSIEPGLRVLLAEDGPDNRRLIEHLLRRIGAEVVSVENGVEAVDRILSGHPVDVLLLDMQMPVMDGWEAARRLRNAGCEVPIIALTANALPGDRAACLEAGCDEYLSKPVRPGDLASTIAAVLDRRTRGFQGRKAG